MCCCDELNATFGDCSRGKRFGLGSDLVDHNDLGHVILHRLYHHRMLKLGPWNLHSTAGSNSGVRNVAITRNLIALAHDLGMAVIAEEVERKEQLDFLLEHGCEYIQGFLFNRPMEVEELERLARVDLRDSEDRGAAPGP